MMCELDGQPDKDIVYYFFDSPRKDSLSTIHFMRSILHQLLNIKNMTVTVQHRLEAMIGVDGEREPDFDELFELIVEMCGNRSQVFFIIDGIDETELEERRVVLRFLRIILKDLPTCKFFIASQPEVDISSISISWQAIHLKPSDLDSDIRTFIDFRMDHTDHSEFRSMCKPEAVETIKQSLALKAKGMYVETHGYPFVD
jgi:hypothetical protein